MEKHALYRDNLTIRDHFAGRAMQAMIASLDLQDVRAQRDDIVTAAYALADAMLAERDRP